MGEVMHAPWITHEAKRYLDAIIKSGMHIFEWGSGGSTIYLGLAGAGVITIEHDKEWHDDVAAEIETLGLTGCKLHHIPAEAGRIQAHIDPYWPGNYFERHPDGRFHDSNFRRYASAIDRFAPGHFDIIMVDGAARSACLKHAEPKLKEGGYLIWDNSNRPHVNEYTQKLFEQWDRAVFWGLGPINTYKWETTVWRRATSLDSKGLGHPKTS